MKRKSFDLARILLCCGLVLSAVLPAEVAAQTIRMMPLGNSLTDGDGSSHLGGYRYYLYSALKDANVQFDFVGSLQGGSGFPDIDHEGHGGFRADQLTVRTYLKANPADVVFLEIGTNDVTAGESATEVRDDIEALVDSIHSVNSSMAIYLGTLIPRKDSAALQTVTDNLNALLPNLVNTKAAAGYKIYLVDLASSFLADPNWQNNLMSDAKHPNDAGYQIIGQEWFNAFALNAGINLSQFSDNFNSGGLSASWVANAAFQVNNGQLTNTSTVDAWNNFIAVPSVIYNANTVEFKYGSLSDAAGRAFSGAAVMLDAASTTANGYLVFHNAESSTLNRVRLWTLVNGVPGTQVAFRDVAYMPKAGDTFRVDWSTDSNGHHFCVYSNGNILACLDDPAKSQGNASKLYAGVMINGGTNNGIDDFVTARVSDTTPPAAVNDLRVTSVTALDASLQWTAPGDDDNTGQARSYQLRYSKSPITEANFSSATLVTDLPQPDPAGSPQAFTVGGLNSGVEYYFALKTSDERSNLSALSNVASGTTKALEDYTDGFNRAGPELGSKWAAEPVLQIVNGAVQNVATPDVWSAAIYRQIRNPVAATIRWGPNATTYGTNWCGILVMANSTNTAQVSGYMIQRYAEGGKTRLWHVLNGQLVDIIDQGNSLAPNPKAGSEMKVVVHSDVNGHYFDVYIDNVIDRLLADPQKLEGASSRYAGFFLESTLGAANAIDNFSLGVLPAAPKSLVKVSGDNQTGPAGQLLPQALAVSLIDSSDNPMSDQLVNFAVISGAATLDNGSVTDDNIRLEAERAQVTPPMETRSDPEAAGGKYIVYPTGHTEDASAILTFKINQAGNYRIWTRSQKPGSQPGSWTISVDGGNDFIYDVFQGSTESAWTWDLISARGSGSPQNPQSDPRIFNFAVGTHTIEFKARWEDTRLDKILITNDQNIVPDGKEEVGYLTDANGLASAKVTLGGQIGKVEIQASFSNLAPVTFTANAAVGAADSLVPVAGSGQSGPAGKLLAQPLKVKVTDHFGNAVANKAVSWVVTQGNGMLTDYVSQSDAQGVATTTFAPGNRSANNKVSARATYAEHDVEFTATTTSGIGDAAAIVSGAGQTGSVATQLAAPLIIKVSDTSGKGVANYPVEAKVTAGGGSVSAGNPVRNGSFENASGSVPAIWALESNPSASEVLLANDARNGSKSLRVNSTRNGVGVSQGITYDANAGYTLSFWAKVRRGTARVAWRHNDANGVQVEKAIDLAFVAADSAWRQYMIFAQNGAAGARSLLLRTFGSAEFFIDDVKILRNTGSDGQLAMTWTLGDTAMAQKVAVNDGALIDNRGALKGFPLTFTANAKAGTPKTLTLHSGNGQIGSAGQPLPIPFTVKAVDNFGNGVEKVNVTFTVTAGNGQFENKSNSKVVPTDSTGAAMAVLTLGPTPGVTNTVSATAQGLAGTLTFNAIAAIPSKLEAATNVTKGSAGYPVNPPLTVRVLDNSGNRISGFPVVFNVTAGGGNIGGKTTATIPTDANGEAKAALVLGPTAGAQNKVVVTATSNGQALDGSGITLSVTAAKLKELLLASGNNQTGIVGEPLPKTIRAKVQDELGNGIKGQNVTFTVVAGDGKFGDNVNTKTALTDSLGVAAVSWILGPKPGQDNNRARAETNPSLDGSPLTFVASAKVGPPSVLKEVSGDSLSGVASNPLPAPFVTQVTDKSGNGLSGIAVVFTVKSGGGKFDGVTKDTVRTDANGYAQITLTVGSAIGRFNNVVEARAFNGSLELTNSPMMFVASATQSSARLITMQAGNRQFGKAGQPLANPLAIKVFDRNNVPVPTHPVHFRVMTGGGVFANGKADTTVNTNSNGVARAILTLGGLVQPDSQLVHATSNDGVDQLQNSPIRFVAYASAGLPSGSTSYVDATSPVPADGVSLCYIKVFVRDPFDNAVPNVSLTIQVSGESKTFPILNTDGQGKAEFSLASTRAGRRTISMKINGAAFGRSATMEFTALAAEQMNMVSGQQQTGNVNTALPQLLAVNVFDKFKNGVPNHPVDFIIEAGNGRLLKQSPLLTDSAGVASVTYVLGPAAGANRIRAESSGLSNSPITFAATATNANPANLEYVGGNNQQAVAGQTLSQPLIVKVTDANKRAVYNVSVNFSVNFGGGNVNGRGTVDVRTDEYGEARVNWQLGSAAGVNTVRASVAGLAGSPIDFQAIAASGTATTLVPFSGDGASGRINQPLPTPLTVRVNDANGNGADGVHVFFELIQGTGTLSGGTGNANARDVTTSNGGFAAAQITFGGEIGARKIRITALKPSGLPLSGSPMTFTVFGRAGAVKSIEAIARTNNQSGTANKPLNFPLQVMAYDDQRNPVEGVQINFAVTLNSGFFAGGALNKLVVTNSSGVAEVEWTIKGGTNKAQASAVGSSMPAITFVATGVTNNNFPIFTDIPNQQNREGERIEFVVSAKDDDNEPLRYGAKNLPLGAVFDSLGTRIFTWQTDQNSAGRYEASLLVYDSRGGVDEEIVVIDVLNRNQAPVITSRVPVGNHPGRPDTTLLEAGTLLRMKVVAQDPDGDVLSYRWYANGKFAGSVFDTFDFRGELAFNTIEAWVFDLEDTVRTIWSVKVPVELSSFTADVGSGPGVVLNWRTGTEINNAGFNILRGRSSSGNYTKLNDKLIPANREGSYSFIDAMAEAGARYYYKLEAVDTRGNITTHGPIVVTVAPPDKFDLSQNYPNPFWSEATSRFAGNPTTQIRYQLPQAVQVSLTVYNMLGQEVRKLVNAKQPAGYHTAIWDGRDNSGRPVPTGVYHYRLQAGSFTTTKKMLMAK